MLAEMAAAYCGERHVEDFLERVGKTYPQPRVRETVRRRFWYRVDLDRAMGLGEESAVAVPKSMGARFRKAVEARKARGRPCRQAKD